MKLIKLLAASAFVLMSMTGAAFANAAPTGDRVPITPLPRAMQLADSVVVTPQTSPPVAQAPVETVPTAVPVAPVEAVPARHTTVIHEEPHNYMATIAVSAIMGAVAGFLVGGAIYYLDGRDHGYRIGYWTAGGVIVGAAVGVTQVLVEQSRVDAVAARFPTDPAPTYRLALLTLPW